MDNVLHDKHDLHIKEGGEGGKHEEQHEGSIKDTTDTITRGSHGFDPHETFHMLYKNEAGHCFKHYIISNNLHFEMTHVASLTQILKNVDAISVIDMDTLVTYNNKIRELRSILNKYINTIKCMEKANKDLDLFKLTAGPIVSGFKIKK